MKQVSFHIFGLNRPVISSPTWNEIYMSTFHLVHPWLWQLQNKHNVQMAIRYFLRGK